MFNHCIFASSLTIKKGDMKSTIFVIVILATAISCKNQTETKHVETTPEAHRIAVQNVFLSEKILEYNYGDNVYEVNFESESKLHWKCVKGDEIGKEADEIYFSHRLSKQSLFISWIEKDGLGVSQVLNFKNKTVNTFLKIGKELIPLSGTLREL
jgi:hypothetical protein